MWDILEEGVGNLRLDEEGVALDRKAHTTKQKKLYKKHHLIRGILVAALPHKEYLKMSDKSTAKAMFTSLCSNYEGNKKVREAKATMLVHQYELFRMKEDESRNSKQRPILCAKTSKQNINNLENSSN